MGTYLKVPPGVSLPAGRQALGERPQVSPEFLKRLKVGNFKRSI